MKRFLATTVDNPYHPADDYDNWRLFDREHGYYTEEKVARLAGTSIYLTDIENQRIINGAVSDLVSIDPLGLYTFVVVDE